MLNKTSITHWLNKVPEVGLVFWLIKIMSTTVGETAADYLNFTLQFGLLGTTAVVGVLLSVCLFIQLTQARYVPSIYWTSVTVISVFGTLVTDNLTDNYNISLLISSAVFALLLACIFFIWYVKERTLSIYSINTRKRETFYWSAILMTFALGTAVGDYVSEALHLGYAISGLVFGSLILLIWLTHFTFKANSVTCFWLAYILTRPLGASLGDLLTQPNFNGGLGLASTHVNLIFLGLIITFVSHLSCQQIKLKSDTYHA